jgi:hypothetical protein
MSLIENEIFEESAVEAVQERTGLKYEELGEKLGTVAHNMDKFRNIARILKEAKKRNPRGLIF